MCISGETVLERDWNPSFLAKNGYQGTLFKLHAGYLSSIGTCNVNIYTRYRQPSCQGTYTCMTANPKELI